MKNDLMHQTLGHEEVWFHYCRIVILTFYISAKLPKQVKSETISKSNLPGLWTRHRPKSRITRREVKGLSQTNDTSASSRAVATRPVVYRLKNLAVHLLSGKTKSADHGWKWRTSDWKTISSSCQHHSEPPKGRYIRRWPMISPSITELFLLQSMSNAIKCSESHQ